MARPRKEVSRCGGWREPDRRRWKRKPQRGCWGTLRRLYFRESKKFIPVGWICDLCFRIKLDRREYSDSVLNENFEWKSEEGFVVAGQSERRRQIFLEGKTDYAPIYLGTWQGWDSDNLYELEGSQRNDLIRARIKSLEQMIS